MGFALSTSMLLTVAGSASLPALSMQTPVFVTDWSAPLVDTVAPLTVLVPVPDCGVPASAQVKSTMTFWLVQVPGVYPLVSAVITGLVLSMSMLPAVMPVAALPALSMQAPTLATDWFSPSVLMVLSSTTSSVAMP